MPYNPTLCNPDDYAPVRVRLCTCEVCGKSVPEDDTRRTSVEHEDGETEVVTVCVPCRDEIESAEGDRHVARMDHSRAWPLAVNE